MINRNSIIVGMAVLLTSLTRVCFGQHDHAAIAPPVSVDPQPVLAQALRLDEALTFLGSALSASDHQRLIDLKAAAPTQAIVTEVQRILDPYCLAVININPEARVKVAPGAVKPQLIQGGWTSYLVKIYNEAGVTSQLQAESPNAATPLYAPTYDPRVSDEKKLSAGQVAARFLEMDIYRNRPMSPNLSGLRLEYAVLQIYSKEAGSREVELGFNVGQGTQDIGFRNTIHILFAIKPSVRVTFHIKDDDGTPAMASFIITDGVDHLAGDSGKVGHPRDFRLSAAQQEFSRSPDRQVPVSLRGIYPLPSRRVAAYDEYPDFFFQPQIYRSDGEHVMLPAGKYQVRLSRGPEYIPQLVELTVPPNVQSFDASFQLKRWINMRNAGWYSADHHVHGGGCSHYESPEEGVPPKDMWRQEVGEDLNIAAVLAWGPSWYHQKTFFTGKDDPLSTGSHLLRNDVEVSGFPSSHAGHIVLLRLREDDYPGTTKIEEWPSWTLPVLTWARSQKGVVGYAHSGWGLQPVEPTNDLPNYVMPAMDGIGANEYVVTVTQNAVDFYSAGDTPINWELNMWYHSLNCGFRTRLSGETDFPCIYDERVGIARSYFKAEGPLNYDSYVASLQKGRSFVSDGRSFLVDFKVDGAEPGVNNSELLLTGPSTVKASMRVAAYLESNQSDLGKSIARRAQDESPYWDIERARIGISRKVRVELLVNGVPVDTVETTADGVFRDVTFNYLVKSSCWIATRVLYSSHSNPVFVIVNGKPIRDLKSARWSRAAVDQCWTKKEPAIRQSEKEAAMKAYDDARNVYDKIIAQALKD